MIPRLPTTSPAGNSVNIFSSISDAEKNSITEVATADAVEISTAGVKISTSDFDSVSGEISPSSELSPEI